MSATTSPEPRPTWNDMIAAIVLFGSAGLFFGGAAGFMFALQPKLDYRQLKPSERYEVISQDEELCAIFQSKARNARIDKSAD